MLSFAACKIYVKSIDDKLKKCYNIWGIVKYRNFRGLYI